MGQTGSYASNFKEGKRSEYLAQYFFSSLGSAVPVPSPEDTGLDLHCTISDVIDNRAWPRCFFTVQVKSEMNPWVMEGNKSVEWVANQPFPIFLCIVDKKAGRIRIYQTLVRHYLRAHPPLPDRFELIPEEGENGSPTLWKRGVVSYSLSAPILDFSLDKLTDDEFAKRAKSIISNWVEFDNENTFMRSAGIQSSVRPLSYQTNQLMESPGRGWSGLHPRGDQWELLLMRLSQLLRAATGGLYSLGLKGLAVRMVLACREFSTDIHMETFAIVQELCRHWGLPKPNSLSDHNACLDRFDAEIEKLLPDGWKRTRPDDAPKLADEPETGKVENA